MARTIGSVMNALDPKKAKKGFSGRRGALGYDNPREVIDPHVRTKVLSAREAVVDVIYLDAEHDTYIRKDKTTGKVEIWRAGKKRAAF